MYMVVGRMTAINVLLVTWNELVVKKNPHENVVTIGNTSSVWLNMVPCQLKVKTIPCK